MPDYKLVDTRPLPRTQPTPLEQTLAGFSQRHRENQLQQRDTDALKDIYEQYQNTGQNIEQALQSIDTNPNLSPSRRIEATKNFMELKKYHNEAEKERLTALTKAAELHEKKREKQAEDEAKIREAEFLIDQNDDILPEDKPAAKKALTPVSARALLADAAKKSEVDYKIASNIHERFAPEIKATSQKANQAKSVLPNLDAAIVNNEKYDASEKLWDNIIDATDSRFLQRFKSKTGQELETITPIAVSSFGQKMSGVLTNSKMDLISKKAAGLGKDKSANRMLLYMDKFDKNIDVIKARITNEMLSENRYGLAGKDFELELDRRMHPYQQMIADDINMLLEDKIPTSPMSQKITDSPKKKYKMISRDGKFVGEVPYDRINEAIQNDGMRYIGDQ